MILTTSSLSSGFAVVFPGYDIKCGIMQISSFYRAKKHPPHSKRGGYFFIFGQNFNLMTLVRWTRYFFMFHLQHQRRCAVHPGGQLAVEHVQTLGVGAEQLHLGDQVIGIGLLLALLLDEPVQELHGAEVLHLIGGSIDVVDETGHILLMLQAGLQGGHIAGEHLVGLVDGLQGHGLVVVVQVLIEQQGVVPLLLGLDLVPVGEAVQAPGLIVVGEVQIQIGGVELLVNLLVQQLLDFGIQHIDVPPFHNK